MALAHLRSLKCAFSHVIIACPLCLYWVNQSTLSYHLLQHLYLNSRNILYTGQPQPLDSDTRWRNPRGGYRTRSGLKNLILFLPMGDRAMAIVAGSALVVFYILLSFSMRNSNTKTMQRTRCASTTIHVGNHSYPCLSTLIVGFNLIIPLVLAPTGIGSRKDDLEDKFMWRPAVVVVGTTISQLLYRADIFAVSADINI